MADIVHFSATDARKKFFELLRLANSGKMIEIEKNDEKTIFELKKKQKKPVKDIVKIAKEMGKIGLKAPADPQDLKRIILESKQFDVLL